MSKHQKNIIKGRLSIQPKFAGRILAFLLLIALLGDFIANEKPLYCKVEGKNYFPVLKSYTVDLGLAKWDPIFVQNSWKDIDYEKVIYPPIPYSATTLDIKNSGYAHPFKKQRVKSKRFHHFLGTDQLGRDVAAGLVSGTRTAMLVGFIAMGIAALLGIFMGAIAGYFGNTGLQLKRGQILLGVPALILGFFYGFIARSYAFSSGAFLPNLLKGIAILVLISALGVLLGKYLPGKFFQKKKPIAIDTIILKMIEVLNSIPGLLLILAVVAIMKKQSIFNLMAIIGMISWTSIARFTRAEMMKVRQMPYITAAKAMAFPEGRIILRHALPNALGPATIAIAFGVANAILAEATLSFIGIGLPAEMVTWGSMLSQARTATDAWWLALLPGLAIFITVTVFNLIGEEMSEKGR